MGTTTLSEIDRRRQLRQHIARWRDNVIDWEIRVDDDRHDVDAAVARLRESARERDAAQRHLANLLALHNDIRASDVTVRFAIANRPIVPVTDPPACQ